MSFKEIRKIGVLFIYICFLFFGIVSCDKEPKFSFEERLKKGDDFFDSGDYISALINWEEALKTKPASIKVLSKIAQAHINLSEYSKAEKKLEKILVLQPDSFENLLNLAKLQLISGKTNEAYSNWKKLNKNYGDDPNVIALYGDLLLMTGNEQSAENQYKKAIEIQPDKTFLIKLATCYLSQDRVALAQNTFAKTLSSPLTSREVLLQSINFLKLNSNYEDAEKLFLKAILLDPEDLSLQLGLAKFYFDIEAFQKSKKIINKLIIQTPQNQTVKKYLLKILLAQNEIDHFPNYIKDYESEMIEDPEFNLIVGSYYLLAEKTSLAEEYLKRVLKEKPNEGLAHYLLGVAYLWGNHIYLSEKSFVKTLSINHFFFEAEIALADIHYKKREFSLSREYAIRTLDKEPENFRARMVLGNIYLAKKQYEKALLLFNTALTIKPNSQSAIYYLAIVNECLQRFEKAVELYELLLENNPDLVDVAWRYKELLVKNGRTLFAKQYFKNKVRQLPQNGYLHYILGEIYLIDEESLKAIDCFKKSIDLLPSMTSSYIKLDEIYERNGQIEDQVETLKMSIKEIPGFKYGYIKLSKIHLQQNNRHEAIQILETARKKYPNAALIANNLGYLYIEKNQDINKGFELIRQAYLINPDDPAVVDSLGWAYYKKKMYAQAVNYLEEASLMVGNDALINNHLTIAKRALMDRKEKELPSNGM